MKENIEAILFDMGGTLRTVAPKSETEKKKSMGQIMALLGAQSSVDEFSQTLSERAKAYKSWSEETLIELNEKDLWTQWMLPDWPAAQIERIAIQLNQMYQDAIHVRKFFPEAREVILALYRRGYRLGLASNTTCSMEVPATLLELKLAGCFEIVVLSAKLGKRKPDPALLLQAAEQMGIAPEKCVYIGNSLHRDVAAARKAGFAQAIIHQAPGGSKLEQKEDPELAPDQYIGNLKELLDIFPERLSPQPLKVYNASLSTMWAQKNFPALNDFFEFARRAGFASIELNHKINSKMLADVDLSQYPIRSIHEPCPADISVETLKSEDWLVSALDEENRRKGVAAIQRSIDIAHQLGVAAIVVHVGHTELDLELEKQLRSLYDSGLKGSEDYQALQERMMKKRSELAAPGLAAVKKSLGELLAYAKPYGIRLGLENRYHFMEYPSPDELGILLEMAGPEQLGFIFDVGHAQHLSRLGFYPHDEWLIRFSARIIGTHLHDVIGLQDHYTPGRGNVDYDEIAAYLPENAFRTCEFMESNSPDQIKAGLSYLAQKRCVTIL